MTVSTLPCTLDNDNNPYVGCGLSCSPGKHNDNLIAVWYVCLCDVRWHYTSMSTGGYFMKDKQLLYLMCVFLLTQLGNRWSLLFHIAASGRLLAC